MADKQVWMSTGWWRDMAGHTIWARDLYQWLWTNEGIVNGSSGIGRITNVEILRAEVQGKAVPGVRGLDDELLEQSWRDLETDGKVVRDGIWYIVIERIYHTCLHEGASVDKNQIQAVKNYLAATDVPESIRKAIAKRYPGLFKAPEKLLLSHRKSPQKPKAKSGGGPPLVPPKGLGEPLPQGLGAGEVAPPSPGTVPVSVSEGVPPPRCSSAREAGERA